MQIKIIDLIHCEDLPALDQQLWGQLEQKLVLNLRDLKEIEFLVGLMLDD